MKLMGGREPNGKVGEMGRKSGRNVMEVYVSTHLLPFSWTDKTIQKVHPQ